jgi:ABC-type Zn uptake system ZnuABC Zn-binding protein ZnuA
MVDPLDSLINTHEDYLNWLDSQSSQFQIMDFIQYVKNKSSNYDNYKKTGNKAFVDELPRAMNRYLDEFEVSSDFRKTSYEYFAKMNQILNQL